MALVSAQGVGYVLNLRNGRGQHVSRALEFGVQVQLVLQLLQRGVQQLQCVVVGIGQLFQRGLGCVQQGLSVRQAAVASVQALPLVSAGVELVDLANLPGQAFAFALQGVLRLQRCGQRALGLAPALPQAS